LKKNESRKDKLIGPVAILIGIGFAIYFEKLPGRNGGLTPQEEPYFYWGIIIFAVIFCLDKIFAVIETKKEPDKDSNKET